PARIRSARRYRLRRAQPSAAALHSLSGGHGVLSVAARTHGNGRQGHQSRRRCNRLRRSARTPRRGMIRAHTGFTFRPFPKARSHTARMLARQWQWLFGFWIYVLAASLHAAPALTYEVIARYPHRTGAFTQGLELAGATLYESSGLYGQSYVARWQP